MSITITQADEVHTIRKNADWLALSNDNKTAAIAKAGDYIEAYYAPFKTTVLADEPRLVNAWSLLAREMAITPPAMKADQVVKSKELQNGDKVIKTTFEDSTGADPYPLISALLAPLREATANNGMRSVRMVM